MSTRDADAWRIERTLRAQLPTYDGSVDGLTTPVNDLPRGVRYHVLTCTRAAPTEVRGAFFGISVLRIGTVDDAGPFMAELSFGGAEFRDAIPIVAGSSVDIPRTCSAFWVRAAPSDAGDSSVSVELLLSLAPAVMVNTQHAVVTSARAGTFSCVASAGGTVVASVPLRQRGAYRIAGVVNIAYDGTPMAMPARYDVAIAPDVGGVAVARLMLAPMTSGTAGVRSGTLDTVVPIYPATPGVVSGPTAVNLLAATVANHVIGGSLYVQPQPLAAGTLLPY